MVLLRPLISLSIQQPHCSGLRGTVSPTHPACHSVMFLPYLPARPVFTPIRCLKAHHIIPHLVDFLCCCTSVKPIKVKFTSALLNDVYSPDDLHTSAV